MKHLLSISLIYLLLGGVYSYGQEFNATETRQDNSSWLVDYNEVFSNSEVVNSTKKTLYFPTEADLDAWLLSAIPDPLIVNIWVAKVFESLEYTIETGPNTIDKNPDPIALPYRVNYERLAVDGSGVWIFDCVYSDLATLQDEVDEIVRDDNRRLIMSDPPFRTEHWEESLVAGKERVVVSQP